MKKIPGEAVEHMIITVESLKIQCNHPNPRMHLLLDGNTVFLHKNDPPKSPEW